MLSWKERIHPQISKSSNNWLVTGVAGFIGSNILEYLLDANQSVIGLDNFSTGQRANFDDVRKKVGPTKWKKFHFVEGDISDFEICRECVKNADIVLHQAALGSVPRSIKEPSKVNIVNVGGFLNLINVAKETKVKRFVYASSSSVYGDYVGLPKVEDKLGNPLSPYAVTKMTNELYAKVFNKIFNLETIGLRYFNVFGKRQNINGPYAAVIPTWIKAFIDSSPIVINGDGKTSRDFCYVDNAVQINILSGLTENKAAINENFNVACGEQWSLLQVFEILKNNFAKKLKKDLNSEPRFGQFREGDIMHSLADINKAKSLLQYQPEFNLVNGLDEVVDWYLKSIKL